MNRLTWIGQLYDGRLVLETEPVPTDAPTVAGSKSKWKSAWKCEMKDRTLWCGAPINTACRCVEVFNGEG